MPVYVYRNLETGETFEIQQRITDDALTVDPRTGDPVRRVIQPVGIAFKGSGFYVNDSRSSSGTGTAKEGSAPATDSAAAPAAKPEPARPEAGKAEAPKSEPAKAPVSSSAD